MFRPHNDELLLVPLCTYAHCNGSIFRIAADCYARQIDEATVVEDIRKSKGSHVVDV